MLSLVKSRVVRQLLFVSLLRGLKAVHTEEWLVGTTGWKQICASRFTAPTMPQEKEVIEKFHFCVHKITELYTN